MGDGTHNFGGVSPEEIEALYRETCAPPGIANASPLGRFSIQVATLVSLRWEAQEEGAYAVFLLSSRVRDYIGHCIGDPHPFLLYGNQSILDKVWISSAPIADARKVNIAGDHVGAIYASLEQSELAVLPAVFIDWTGKEPRAQLYYEGLNKSNKVITMDLSGNPITPDKMKEALDHEYFTRFRTPQLIAEGHATKLWKNASQGIPEKRAEERIQGRLMDTLQNRFPRHNVRGEPVVEDGRADIAVWVKRTDAQGNPVSRTEWVLELKALREKTYSGGPVSISSQTQSIREGLTQVLAYRANLSALESALCFYDMRNEHAASSSCFEDIEGEAQEQKVYLWRWFLYRSARAARNNLTRDGASRA